jgi:hypothetical protein
MQECFLQGTKVVWAEIAYDARWARKDYSVIKTYDFNEGKSEHSLIKLNMRHQV